MWETGAPTGAHLGLYNFQDLLHAREVIKLRRKHFFILKQHNRSLKVLNMQECILLLLHCVLVKLYLFE